MAAIPDLWRAQRGNKLAVRLYNLFLCHLLIKRAHERIVEVCPIIRRFAARGPGRSEGGFTFSIES